MPRRTALLVASTGGHLEQISRLAPRFSPHFDDVAFATFDDQQSRSLLAGSRTYFVTKIPPRGLREALEDLQPALRIIRSGRFTDVISTGSAIAVPFLVAARMLGARAHYIESAARADGPSLSGRIVARVPGVRLYCQYPSWAGDRWTYSGSVLDHFQLSATSRPARPVARAVVTLGTMRGYPFTRAVRAAATVLAEVGTPDREVLWQVGDVDPALVPGEARAMVPSAELNSAIDESDLVIAHAGVGSSLRILASGRAPVLLHRQSAHGEHIDDHQRMIATELARRDLAVSRDPDAMTAADAESAMSRLVVESHDAAPFTLHEGKGSAPQAPEAAQVRPERPSPGDLPADPNQDERRDNTTTPHW